MSEVAVRTDLRRHFLWHEYRVVSIGGVLRQPDAGGQRRTDPGLYAGVSVGCERAGQRHGPLSGQSARRCRTQSVDLAAHDGGRRRPPHRPRRRAALGRDAGGARPTGDSHSTRASTSRHWWTSVLRCRTTQRSMPKTCAGRLRNALRGALADWMARQTRSGVQGMSMWVMPRWDSGVDHGVLDGRGRPDRARLADALGPERVAGAVGLGVGGLEAAAARWPPGSA